MRALLKTKDLPVAKQVITVLFTLLLERLGGSGKKGFTTFWCSDLLFLKDLGTVSVSPSDRVRAQCSRRMPFKPGVLSMLLTLEFSLQQICGTGFVSSSLEGFRWGFLS